MIFAWLAGCLENEIVGGVPAREGPAGRGPAEEVEEPPDVVRPVPRLAEGRELPAWDVDRPPPPGPPAAFLFDETIHRFDLVIDDDAADAIDEVDGDVPAVFRYDDQEWLVGLRLKGSHSRRGMSQKAAFKIDFGELVPDQDFHGLRRMTLNNMVQDGSMIREHVIYRAYAAVGVPAPRHGYAELWVNDELWGLYGVLDTMDGRFARWAFAEEEDGWLYEGGNGADLMAGREERFQVQARGAGEPWLDVVDLVAELDAAGDVMDVIDRFDPSVFLMWATDLAAGNQDGYTRRRNNYLVYHGAGRWWFVPWGNDQALRDGMGIYDGFFGRMLLDCDHSEACMARLDEALRTVADTWEAIDLAGYADATGALVAEACERDPRREDPCSHAKIGRIVEARLAAIRHD